ncbi:MAG: hypothetical protein K2K97_07390 [Muribaculaceae bacterium]|nr:hypothetical protein [Muribaculaceae bacterium]
MQATLQDLLHAINILGDDRDVTVDGIDSIAVCPPIKMTPAGREHFKQALTANVVVEYENDSHQYTCVSDADEKIDQMAWELLSSLAGYCYVDGYDQWFEGETAELI